MGLGNSPVPFVSQGEYMKFFFYRADSKYCDFLRKTDKCVPYTMDKKASRPFVERKEIIKIYFRISYPGVMPTEI